MALLCLAGSAGCATSEPTHPADGPPVRSSAAVATATGGWHGTVPKVSRSRPSFTLTDTAGHSFDFARQTAGRATLLFFGYTNCPDVCPTTMADIAAAKRLARNDAGSALTVVFVTTDPGRDSAEALRRWLDQFDSSFTGSPAHRLTGSPAQIDAAQQAVGIPLAQTQQAPGGQYDVAHAAQVAAYGVDDVQHVLYFASSTVADYAADLPRLVTASGERP
ncbi:SCO family protein [Protofrankia symbiont of Coriaria myrtifolia]|uniref:SCO family protein n=1 Tax=Protofrankia symbiont of Coriaria myrtifolia TaxID=1306540 RepID=UPI0010417876|nr:SCO family protein [Protofrankia symbiont of Coriaria myrtifolia]